MAEAQETDFERGKEAGRVAQVLDEHSEHLARINGSIDDTARALRDLTDEIRDLRHGAERTDQRAETTTDQLAGEIDRRAFRLTRTEKIAAGVLIVGLPIIGYLAVNL